MHMRGSLLTPAAWTGQRVWRRAHVRPLKRVTAIALACSFMLSLPAKAQVPPSVAADLILLNGKIVTVDANFNIEEAVAISGDRILDVGDDDEIAGFSGPGTKTVDLKGKTVIPGLVDGHYHFLSKAVDQYLGVEVALVESIDEMVARIGRKVEETEPGQLVYTTSGWMPAQLKEKRPPTRYDLDPVSPNNPVIVQGGHSIYLNSYALREASITRDTVSPEGGTIEKDPETGEPTGRLMENAARLANQWTRGQATHEEKLAALQAGQKKLNAVGITGIREPGISAADMRAYQALRTSGDLTVRVSMSYRLDPSRPAEDLIDQLETWGVGSGFGDSMLRLDGIGEFGIDGGFEAGLMSDAYAHAPGEEAADEYYGLQRIPTAKFERVLQAMSRLGWRACIHIVGDRGLDVALDAYEKAGEAESIAGERWVIEHAHYTRPDQFDRIKELGLVISTQFHPYMAAGDMVHFWGEERASKSMRMRDWLNAGLIVGGGSDWSLLPANPFWMMYFWVTRDTRLWGVLGADQRISREDALRVMTINNAYITHEEEIKGSIEPGKLADMVVLSDDILTVPEEEIREIVPLVTLLGGKVVYQRPESPVVIE